MHHFVLEKDGSDVLEVCACEGPLDGALLGYAIRFAGKWDGWQVEHPYHTRMLKVAIGVDTSAEAIAEIVGNCYANRPGE
jgi:hypothetical protein